MKKIIMKLCSPIKQLDYILLMILVILIVTFCFVGGFVALFIWAGISIVVERLFPDYREYSDLAVILTWSLLPILLTALAGSMIRKMRVWLLSLPVQFLLYFGATCCQLPNSNNLTVGECVLWAGGLVLVQLPGVAVSLLIRFIIRKIRARKQTAPAE